jgi:hypothetical protein
MIAVPGSWHRLSLPATIGSLLGDESHSAFLVPFVKLGTDEGRGEINAAEDPRTEYDKFVTLLTPWVVALDGYWKRRLDEKKCRTARSF